jgi:alpha-tubulin suppressor-like RCC1 family protein
LSCSSISARDLSTITYEPSATLANVKSVAVGNDHACAITQAKDAWCWGKNDAGQLGLTPSATPIANPGQARSHVERLTLGLSHTCVVSTKSKPQVECFGDDTLGQLGGFSNAGRSSPPPFDAADIADLTAGFSRTCALMRGGAVWCWGGYLAVDLATNQPSFAPTRVADLPADVVQIAAGGDSICARTAQGTLYCWGILQCLEPGACPAPVHPVPSLARLMKTPAPATNVQVGDQHMCAQLQTGQVVCSGANQFSQLGAVLPLVQTIGHATCVTKEWFEAWSSPEFLPVAW